MFPTKRTNQWELGIAAISLFFLFLIFLAECFCADYIKEYPITVSILINVFTGLITAIALLYFQERHYISQLEKYYSEIEGEYKRIDIGQDNAGGKEIENMKNQNLGLKINLNYIKATHSFKLSAEYWKNDSAVIEGTIEFNEKDGVNAVGRYRYISGGSGLAGHSGTYKIYRLEEDETKLLVLFHHLFPRKQENNPDNNRGWEIWQRNSKGQLK